MAIPKVTVTPAIRNKIFAALVGAGVMGPSAYVASNLTVDSEGIVLVPHADPVGLQTICIGHLVKKGEVVKPRYTLDECIEIFVQDWKANEAMLEKVVKVDFQSPWMKGALTDFTLNKGIGNVSTSTLLRNLNKKEYDKACEQLTRWVYAGGKIWPGLVIRASKQYKYCMGEVPGDYVPTIQRWDTFQ